jgi:ribosomal protein L6P/L9E
MIKLNLKGRGYNINLTKQKNVLELKIGFSHIIRLYLPNTILLKKLNKLDIYIFSIYYNDLKNFSTNIKNLKNLDNYKIKGFIYEKEQIKLKEGKKKY